MSKRAFFEGILIAVSAAAGAVLLHVQWPYTLPFLDGLRLYIDLSALLYLGYLLWQGEPGGGRLALLALGAGIALASFFLPLQPVTLLVAYSGLIWLARALFDQHGKRAIVSNLVLALAAPAAAIWAVTQSGSLPLATWCFFLVHSLYALNPDTGPIRSARPSREIPGRDPFLHSYRAALHALERLANQRPC